VRSAPACKSIAYLSLSAGQFIFIIQKGKPKLGLQISKSQKKTNKKKQRLLTILNINHADLFLHSD